MITTKHFYLKRYKEILKLQSNFLKAQKATNVHREHREQISQMLMNFSKD